jgi:hypothetical protein
LPRVDIPSEGRNMAVGGKPLIRADTAKPISGEKRELESWLRNAPALLTHCF